MRKNMKKLTVATVIGAMTVTALAPVGAQAKDKTLTVAIWDNGQKAGLQEIMDEFTKETGIKTELQVVEWSSYWTLLEAGASGGDMPDVFWMHSNEAVRYMSNDILLDLTDKIADSDKLEMDKFPEDIKEMYQWDAGAGALQEGQPQVPPGGHGGHGGERQNRRRKLLRHRRPLLGGERGADLRRGRGREGLRRGPAPGRRV